MADNPVPLAIFDFDGTLSTGHLWVGISKHHKTHKVGLMTLYSYLLLHMPSWVASKMRLYSGEKMRIKWGEGLAVLFKGFSREQANQAFQWITDHYFKSRMREDVLALLNNHKKQGYRVIILSGMLTDFLDVVGKTLGADYVVGTKTEIKDDIYTGKIIQPVCFGENKAKLLKEFIQERKLNVDFSRSFAYADSFSDLQVFKLVGQPIATYPDKELREYAQEHEWQIIRDRATV